MPGSVENWVLKFAAVFLILGEVDGSYDSMKRLICLILHEVLLSV